MRRGKSSPQKPPGQRQLRVGEQLRHVIVEILREGKLRDPILAQSHMITVTAVNIGPDLKHATAYVMPLGGKNTKEIIEALNHASGYFRTEISHRVDLRYVPKVTFKEDTSFEEADHIERLLRQERVQRDVNASRSSEDDQ